MINTQNTPTLKAVETSVSRTQEESSVYSEVNLGKHSPYEKDVLSQFRANLNQLEDIHGRMKFLMAEVSTAIHNKIN